jgi:hypothetical protein
MVLLGVEVVVLALLLVVMVVLLVTLVCALHEDHHKTLQALHTDSLGQCQNPQHWFQQLEVQARSC